MNNIDYEHAFSISQKWAQDLACIAVGYAVEEHLDDEQCNKHHRLNSKQWGRLCTFFIVPNEQMDRKLHFNFEGSLTRTHQHNIIKFIQTAAHKILLDALIVDHTMPFIYREEILEEALDNMPTDPFWEPKRSVFSKNYTCVFDEEHFRYAIRNFIDHHILANTPLCSEKMSTMVHHPTPPVKRSSRTSSVGPM